MVPDRIRSILQEPLALLGLVTEDLTITPAGKRSVVRIAIDDDLSDVDPDDLRSVVAPLSLDEVADATHVISDVLDASDVTGSAPYVLEVSSPGIGRPLTHWRHWRRNVGRLVTVTHVDGSTVHGRIVEVAPDAVMLQVAEPTAGEAVVILADVRKARIDIEFARVTDANLDLDQAGDALGNHSAEEDL